MQNVDDDNLEKDAVSNFIQEERQQKLKGFNNAVYHTRHSIFIAAGLFLVSQVFGYSLLHASPGVLDILIITIVFCSFVALAIFANKKPFSAIKYAAIVFLLYILLTALPYVFANGIEGFFTGLFRGIIFKILIITMLGRNAAKAKAMQTLKEQVDVE
jgi:hypothetical protein